MAYRSRPQAAACSGHSAATASKPSITPGTAANASSATTGASGTARHATSASMVCRFLAKHVSRNDTQSACNGSSAVVFGITGDFNEDHLMASHNYLHGTSAPVFQYSRVPGIAPSAATLDVASILITWYWYSGTAHELVQPPTSMDPPLPLHIIITTTHFRLFR